MAEAELMIRARLDREHAPSGQMLPHDVAGPSRPVSLTVESHLFHEKAAEVPLRIVVKPTGAPGYSLDGAGRLPAAGNVLVLNLTVPDAPPLTVELYANDAQVASLTLESL